MNAPVDLLLEREEDAERHSAAVRALLRPRSVLLLAAGPAALSDAHCRREILAEHSYPGHVDLVCAGSDTEAGDLPERAELAIVCGDDPELVATSIMTCVRSAIPALYILGCGFSEGDSRNPRVDEALRQARAERSTMGAGPNGIRLLAVDNRVPISYVHGFDYQQWATGPLRPGHVAIVSQSGGMTYSVVEAAQARGVALSQVAIVGSESDVETADVLEQLLVDTATEVVIVIAEGFRRPRRLAGLLARFAEAGKPLIVAKLGRSLAAKRAALTHTAHLAGDDRLYSALFAYYGVTEVGDIPEMLDAAAALAHNAGITGRRIGIVTLSGGAGVWLADACAARGFEVPELAPRIKQLILDRGLASEVNNPVDLGADGGQRAAIETVRLLARDPDLDAIVFAGVHRGLGVHAAALARVATGAGKPVLAYAHHPTPDLMASIDKLGVAGHMTPGGVADGLSALATFGSARSRSVEPSGVAEPFGSAVLGRIPECGVLAEHQLKQWLTACGFPIPDGGLARTEQEATAIASRIGYPVALKAQACALPHKSDSGAIVLGVQDEFELRVGYRTVVEAAGRGLSHGSLDGVLVERMAQPGVELTIGVIIDPDLGPFLMIGAGGTIAEVLGDVQIARCPLEEADVWQLLDRLKCRRLLGPWRGAPARDLDAFATLVSRLSRATLAFPSAAEIDLNPVVLHEEGRGVQILDALAQLRPSANPSVERTR